MTLLNLASATLQSEKIGLLDAMATAIGTTVTYSIDIVMDDKTIRYKDGLLSLLQTPEGLELETGSIAEWPELTATDIVGDLTTIITTKRDDLQAAFTTIIYDETP